MIHIQKFWKKLTAPRWGISQDAILQYFTNMVLFWMMISFWFVAAMFYLALWFGFAINPTSDMPLAALLSSFILTIGFWIGYKGHWRIARLIPVSLMFGLGLYSAYFYGLGIVMLIEVSLAILLTVLMWFERIKWWRLVFALMFLTAVGTIRLRYIQPNELFYYFSISTFYLLMFTGLVVFLSREYNFSRSVIQQQLDQLLILQEVNMMVIGGNELGDIMQVIADSMAANTSVDACSILLWEDQSGFEMVAASGFSDPVFFHAQLASSADLVLFEVVVRQMEVHLTRSDVLMSERLRSLFERENFGQYRAMPIKNENMVTGVIEFFHRDEQQLKENENELVSSLVNLSKLAVQRVQLVEDLEMARLNLEVAYMDTLKGWVRMLDLRDHETEHHTLRVAALTQRLAEKMGIDGEELVNIGRGALLHDIGKMAIPDEILNKPGPLTDEEREIMDKHPVYAYEFLKKIDYLRPVLDIPFCHHEQWDGSGYPRGLAGEDIPKSARIFAVVDVLDALLSDRPYRKAWQEEEALRYIQERSGSHFDPEVVAALFDVMAEEGDNVMDIRARVESGADDYEF